MASEPLISAEQYFAGGVESVRGYLENESLGDYGFRWSLELLSPAIRTRLLSKEGKDHLQTVLFYDAAFGWLRDVPVGQLNSFALAGVGAGLRLEWTNYLHAQVDHAWRLRDGPVLDKQGRRTHAFLKILF